MLKYLRVLLICGWRVLWDYFAWMIKYSRHPERYPIEERYKKVRSLIRFILRHFHCDYNVKNIDILAKQEKPCLIVSNHISNADPLVLIANSEKPLSFVAKIEAKKFPFIGRCIRCIDGVFIDRSDIKKSFEAIKETSEKIIKNNISYCVFPEGTRNKNPYTNVSDFKPGAFKIATLANCNVVSVGLFGTFRILETKYNNKRFPIGINFINEYTADQIKEIKTTDLALKIHDEVQEVVTDLIAIDKNLLETKN